MDFCQCGLRVKLTVPLKGQDVGAIGPDLKGSCWGGAKQDSSFRQSQDLQS